MKKRVVITAVMMVFVFLCSQASAGSSSRRRLEGFLIGSGVTILGAAMIGMLSDNDRPRKDRYKAPPRRDRRQGRYIDQRPRSFHIPPPPAYRDRPEPVYAGYHGRPPVNDYRRENRKVWVDPVYEEVWIPGYYNKRQQWVEGYHEKVEVSQGYWKEI